jgi:hypothetical protein
MVPRPAGCKTRRAFFLADYDWRMEPADSIGRLGFARWYERRLIEGHAWFISGFICMVAIAACVEELAFRGSFARLLFYVVVIVGAAATGIYGLIRYHQILAEAERIGEQATCPGCDTYARFKLVSASNARCRKCAHEWRLIEPD